jgi:DNA-binding MarR family transcriptional regulator
MAGARAQSSPVEIAHPSVSTDGAVLQERRTSPGLLLALLGHVAMRRLRDAHTASHLSPRQFHLLGVLHDHGAMSQSELGHTTGTDPSILVTMLNPLEADHLIARERDPEDRRRHLVTLTPAGEQHLNRATEAQRDAENALFVGLDDAQRQQLRGLLIAVQQGLGHEPSCPGSSPGDAD